jgi:hypothetical protein
MLRAIALGTVLLLRAIPLSSQVFMDADSTGDAYARILSKGYGYEVPDCIHPPRHITEVWDSDLRKFVFVFDLHRSIDNDRCINFDRQRTEIKTWGSSPDSMQGFLHETHTSRWRFKLDAGFQPSSSFTHIHQIKPGDGTYDTDNPVITLTPRKSSPNRLEVRFTAPVDEGGNTVNLITVPLAPFLGVWIEAYETVRYDSSSQGMFSLQLRRLTDDSLMLSYSSSALSMWRRGITFCRPKYGIYRSLLDSNSLRDEGVRFADFYLKRGAVVELPASPAVLTYARGPGGRVNLQWSDNSANEGQFRIDRSANGSPWSYLASAKAGSTTYTDSGLVPPAAYSYRVRAENTYGNSSYSNAVIVPTQVTITATAGPNGSISPAGTVSFNVGANQTFTFVPSTGYHVDSVVVDGVSRPPGTSYTFTDLQADHVIRVVFRINTYTISATAGLHGSINPAGPVPVVHGASQVFTVLPATGYHVDSLLVDDARVDSTTRYTFVNVAAHHAIRAVFAADQPLTVEVQLSEGWNLVANPLTDPVGGDSVHALFPTSVYPYVFEFGGGGYERRSILANGRGYWGKFPAPISQSMEGMPRRADSVHVVPGWNIVGTISCPVDTESIVSVPPGIRSSVWFGYGAGYSPSASLVPGRGYWVKSNAAGTFVLVCPSAAGTAVPARPRAVVDGRGP